MEVLAYLVPLALMLGLLGLAAFLWSLQTGQYDDLDGAAWRAIIDDDAPLDRPVELDSSIRAKARSLER
jgi:cbb3-type cytochrome oxidase maturation protein